MLAGIIQGKGAGLGEDEKDRASKTRGWRKRRDQFYKENADTLPLNLKNKT